MLSGRGSRGTGALQDRDSHPDMLLRALLRIGIPLRHAMENGKRMGGGVFDHGRGESPGYFSNDPTVTFGDILGDPIRTCI
jgi:hypothetical protein